MHLRPEIIRLGLGLSLSGVIHIGSGVYVVGCKRRGKITSFARYRIRVENIISRG